MPLTFFFSLRSFVSHNKGAGNICVKSSVDFKVLGLKKLLYCKIKKREAGFNLYILYVSFNEHPITSFANWKKRHINNEYRPLFQESGRL